MNRALPHVSSMNAANASRNIGDTTRIKRLVTDDRRANVRRCIVADKMSTHIAHFSYISEVQLVQSQ